eukprot:3556014-Rhodomonas_salina.1
MPGHPGSPRWTHLHRLLHRAAEVEVLVVPARGPRFRHSQRAGGLLLDGLHKARAAPLVAIPPEVVDALALPDRIRLHQRVHVPGNLLAHVLERGDEHGLARRPQLVERRAQQVAVELDRHREHRPELCRQHARLPHHLQERARRHQNLLLVRILAQKRHRRPSVHGPNFQRQHRRDFAAGRVVQCDLNVGCGAQERKLHAASDPRRVAFPEAVWQLDPALASAPQDRAVRSARWKRHRGMDDAEGWMMRSSSSVFS